jgi:DNA-binding LacI/PurR family transcriptional regulator
MTNLFSEKLSKEEGKMRRRESHASVSDVAQRAGVSPATVSRVLNNTAAVRSSVRARVLAAVTDLHYRSPSPRVVPLARQNSIGLIVPDILNPYFTEIARGVQNEATVDKFLPLILDTREDPQLEHEFIRVLASQPVCGIISCGSRIPSDDLIALRSHIQTPMVVFNRNLKLPNVACILVDLKNATYGATRHLIDLNHTRIAFLNGPSKSETAELRRSGVEWALSEAGIALRPEWNLNPLQRLDGARRVARHPCPRPARAGGHLPDRHRRHRHGLARQSPTDDARDAEAPHGPARRADASPHDGRPGAA